MKFGDAVLDQEDKEVETGEEGFLGGGGEEGGGGGGGVGGVVEVERFELGEVAIECGIVVLTNRCEDGGFEDVAC